MQACSISALSGMQSAVSRHDVTAHNVANVNTPGFQMSRVHQTDVVSGGTRRAAVEKIPNHSQPLSGTDLAKESVNQTISKSTMAFNAKMMKVQQSMTGELLDLFG